MKTNTLMYKAQAKRSGLLVGKPLEQNTSNRNTSFQSPAVIKIRKNLEAKRAYQALTIPKPRRRRVELLEGVQKGGWREARCRRPERRTSMQETGQRERSEEGEESSCRKG